MVQHMLIHQFCSHKLRLLNVVIRYSVRPLGSWCEQLITMNVLTIPVSSAIHVTIQGNVYSFNAFERPHCCHSNIGIEILYLDWPHDMNKLIQHSAVSVSCARWCFYSFNNLRGNITVTAIVWLRFCILMGLIMRINSWKFNVLQFL